MTVAWTDGNSPGFPRFIGLLFLLVVILLCFSIPHRELYWEEGRRVMAAREMISSGDFIIPTVSGKPYLNKPPLYPWLTAVAGFFRGEVDAISVRIPTLIATLLTGACLVWTGIRLGLRRVGVLAAFFFLLCPMIVRKSSLGETDLLLTFGCSVYALEMLTISLLERKALNFAAMIRMVLALVIAFLAKGVAAAPFVIGVMLATAVGTEPGRWRRADWWAPPLLALGVGSLWFIAVLQRPEGLTAVQEWSNEMARAGSSPDFWRHRWEYIAGVLLGFFPATLVLLFLRPRSEKNSWLGDPSLRLLAIAIAIPALFYLLWPGVQPRYLLPAFPLLCWMTARIVLLQFEEDSTDRFDMKIVSRFLQVLMVGVGVFAVTIAFMRNIDAEFWPSLPDLGVDHWIWVAAILFVGAFFPIHWFYKGFPGRSWSRLLMLLLAWAGLHSLVWMPIRGLQRPGEKIARNIERYVPEGRTLWHNLPANWNTLGQVQRDLILFDDEQQPQSGEWLLTVTPEPTSMGGVVTVIELLDGSRASLGVVSSQFSEEK